MGVADERKDLDQVGADCEQLARLIGASREFRLFLESPVVNALKKRKILEELLAARVGRTMLAFVYFLASRGREGLLSPVIAEFSRLRDERMGIINATASVAVPFTPAEEQRLSGLLERVTRKKVRMTYVVDPSLRAGFTVQVADTVWDASVRHELERLRLRFAAGGA
jgi:F-type H+-transporting ATPase subunit delta